MREYREVVSGGRPRANLRQPRQSLSPAERYIGGFGGQPGWQKIGGIGEIGLWFSRERGKRQQEVERQDKLRTIEQHGGDR